MAMVNCPICKKVVSDSNARCPYCDNLLNYKVYCPKCNSSDTAIHLESAEGKSSFVSRLLGAYVSKEKIKYICNDCGNKFKRRSK